MKKYIHELYGKGGVNCSCCRPRSGHGLSTGQSRFKTKVTQIARRREARYWRATWEGAEQ